MRIRLDKITAIIARLNVRLLLRLTTRLLRTARSAGAILPDSLYRCCSIDSQTADGAPLDPYESFLTLKRSKELVYRVLRLYDVGPLSLIENNLSAEVSRNFVHEQRVETAQNVRNEMH